MSLHLAKSPDPNQKRTSVPENTSQWGVIFWGRWFLPRKWANRKRRTMGWVVLLPLDPNLDALEAIVESDSVKSSLVWFMVCFPMKCFCPVTGGHLGLKSSLLCSWFCHWPVALVKSLHSIYVSPLHSFACRNFFPLDVYPVPYEVLPWSLDGIRSLQQWCITAGRASDKTVEHYLKIPVPKEDNDTGMLQRLSIVLVATCYFKLNDS